MPPVRVLVLVPAGEHSACRQHRPAAARRPASTSQSPWARVVFQILLKRQFVRTNNESTLVRKKKQKRKNDTCPGRPHVDWKSILLRKLNERPSRLTHSWSFNRAKNPASGWPTTILKTFTIFEALKHKYHEEILTRMDSIYGYQTIGSHRHHRRPICH